MQLDVNIIRDDEESQAEPVLKWIRLWSKYVWCKQLLNE